VTFFKYLGNQDDLERKNIKSFFFIKGYFSGVEMTKGNALMAGCIAFSMQVVRNKCFLLNPGKNFAQIRLVVFEKNAKIAPLIPKNDVTEPKARLLHRAEG